MAGKLKMHIEPDSLISRASPEVYGEFRSFAQSGFRVTGDVMWFFLMESPGWISDPNLANYAYSSGFVAAMQSCPTIRSMETVKILTNKGVNWFECNPVIGEFPFIPYLLHLILNYDDLEGHIRTHIGSIKIMAPSLFDTLSEPEPLEAIDLLLNSDSQSAIIETRKAIKGMSKENIKWAKDLDRLCTNVYETEGSRKAKGSVRHLLQSDAEFMQIALSEWMSQVDGWSNPIRHMVITSMEPVK